METRLFLYPNTKTWRECILWAIPNNSKCRYYNTDLWHKGIQAIATEGARNHGLLNVAPADFFETNLTMPKDYAEQQQIGSFFQQFDHLITLHQRKRLDRYEKAPFVPAKRSELCKL